MDKFTLVALGSSAGGLEALSEFVRFLEPGLECAYVVVQHLSPDNTSLLTELISRQTHLPVEVVESGVHPKTDHIYITPPNHDIVFELGALVLKEPAEKIGPKPSVNRMLHSMAASDDIFPVGIILSGTGTDGSSGLAAIKSAGGMTIAQEPSSAKYNGMPLASIYAEAVDHILEPREIARNLSRLLQKSMQESVPRSEQTAYYRVISIARAHNGLDLTHYKPATIERRIERRMHETHCPSMNDYADHLAAHPEEIDAFIADVLIPVTSFFRDPESFTELNRVLRERLHNASGNDVFRAWIPGCATGEEAYSIAMLMEEINRERNYPIRYQIFATDLDERALATARAGLYDSESLKDLPAPLRERYLETSGEMSRVVSNLRDHITFSRHNLIQDPPFSRLNLVSCRNLLIYFNSMLQKHVYELFHYALGRDGLLFLGRSESINDNALFETLDRSHRIYQRNNLARTARSLPFMHYATSMTAAQKLKPDSGEPRVDLEHLAYRAVSRQLAPRIVVVNSSDEITWVSEAAKDFLSFRSHQPSLLVHDLIPQPLRAELKAALFRARRNLEVVSSAFHKVKLERDERQIQIQVLPLSGNNFEQLVIFLQERELSPLPISGSEPADDQFMMISQLQHELNATQESLQTVIEELETSNEELQATNEELQSTNEELQSANEELQTTNEELQSTNEELLTVNDEVIQKNQQLEKLNSEFENLYQSSGIPFIIVDRELRIARRHDDLLPLIESGPSLPGAHLANIRWATPIPGLNEQIGEVIREGVIRENQLQTADRRYRVEVRPFLGTQHQIEGAVLSFVDTTDLEQQRQQLNLLNESLNEIFDVSPDGIVAIDEDGLIVQCSGKVSELFGYARSELVGQPVERLMPEQIASEHPKHLQRYRETGEKHIIGVPRRLKARRSDGSLLPIELNVAEFSRQINGMRFLGVIRDISRQLQIEQQLNEHQSNASIALEHIEDGVIRLNERWEVVFANREACRWFSSDLYLLRPISQILRLVDSNERRLDLAEQVSRRHTAFKAVCPQKNLPDRIAQLNVYPFRPEHLLKEDCGGKDCENYVIVIHDVTQQEQAARRLEWENRHDPLTGLLNRKQLISHIETLLKRQSGRSRNDTLLFIDLDQFKVVNDTSGHQAGDELLRQLAGEFMQLVRGRDLVGRLGGDEFVVILENCPLSRAEYVAGNIIKHIQEFRFSYEQKVFRIGASIGLLEITGQQTAAEVLSDADHACYMAKKQGRNRYQVAGQEGSQHQADLVQIQGIAEALETDRFELWFQLVKANNPGQHPDYWEILLRLKNGSSQLVQPGSFIPVAERFSQMHLIDKWVISRLGTLLQSLVNQHGSAFVPQLSFNISAQSLADNLLADWVESSLSASGLPLNKICLEVTETAAITHFTSARKLLDQLHEHGMKIALDDFGSGMASFNYIRQLPVDVIKIDGAFINNVEEDLLDLTIVQSIQHIAEVMDCRTVAENVESPSVLKRVKGLGIDYFQGYEIGRPISQEEWIRRLCD